MATNDKKLVRSKSGLKIVSLNEEAASPFTLKEPRWIPDNQCKACCKCQCRFDFLTRRHHCRRCGDCFCSSCCSKMLPLARMCFVDPVRHCEACMEITKWENDFYDRNLKTLTAGGHFIVNGSAMDNVLEPPVCLLKLSSDHRFIMLDGNENVATTDPIDMRQIEALQIIASGTDGQGNMVASGLLMRYKDSTAEQHTIKLEALEGSLRRQAMAWIASMQKAMKMMYGKHGGPKSPSTPTTPTTQQFPDNDSLPGP